MSRMDAILVVNAGSSSVKFQIFELRHGDDLRKQVKGQIDGIGVRPRLCAEASDGSPLIEKSYAPGDIVDVSAAIAAAADWLRETQDVDLVAASHRVVHGGPDYDRPALVDEMCYSAWSSWLRSPRFTNLTIWNRSGRFANSDPG